MELKIVTQYKCEFCSKKLYVKGAMTRHESKCMKNPVNYQKCYDGCVNLERREMILIDYSDNPSYQKPVPYCKAQERFLYSIRAVQNKLLEKYPETFEDSLPMPKECSLYSNGCSGQTMPWEITP